MSSGRDTPSDDEDWVTEHVEALFAAADDLDDPEEFVDGDMFPDADALRRHRPIQGDDEPEGGAGVREPRRPLIPPGSGAAALELPTT